MAAKQIEIPSKIVEEIKKVAELNKPLFLLLNVICAGMRDPKKIDFQYLNRKCRIATKDVRALFVQLQDIGLGVFSDARLPRNWKFESFFPLKSLANAVLFDVYPYQKSEPVKATDKKASILKHKIEIRKGYYVVIQAPDDITIEEATKVMQFFELISQKTHIT